jgi:GNAT superfamily N-acetyltransferase
VTLIFRRARAGDEDQAVRLVLDRVKWLGDRGSDQWTTRDQAVSVRESIKVRNTWVLCDGPRAVGSLAVSTNADPDFWAEPDRGVPALYITKMATALDWSGRGLGDLLLDCVVSYGRDRGISVVRWDAWRNNPDLHRYYVSLPGVRHVRTVPGLASGALFELAFTQRRPAGVETIAPTKTWATFQTIRQAPPGQSATPGAYWVTVPELTIPGDPPRPLSLSAGGRPAPIIWHAGDHWRVRDAETRPLDEPGFIPPGRPAALHLSDDENFARLQGDLV